MIDHAEVRALRDSIDEARRILNTTLLPAGRAERARELVNSASKQVNAILAKPTFGMLARRGRARVFVKE